MFLNELKESLSRVAFRGIQQNGINISSGNVKINFNESFKNVANYFFYFDRTDFIFTGAGEANRPVITFSKGKVVVYSKNDFEYVKKFASYSFSKGRLKEEAYQIMTLNDDYKDSEAFLPVSALKV